VYTCCLKTTTEKCFPLKSLTLAFRPLYSGLMDAACPVTHWKHESREGGGVLIPEISILSRCQKTFLGLGKFTNVPLTGIYFMGKLCCTSVPSSLCMGIVCCTSVPSSLFTGIVCCTSVSSLLWLLTSLLKCEKGVCGGYGEMEIVQLLSAGLMIKRLWIWVRQEWWPGEFFFSRASLLCYLLFQASPWSWSHPCATAVAPKRSQSFCQKCRWQVYS